MRYPSRMSGRIKFWHPTASAKGVEQAFGLTASNSHSVGEHRVRGDRSPYKDTYCLFQIVPEQDAELAEIVSACISRLRPSHQAIDDLLTTGGRLFIVVQIFDKSFVQLSFDPDLIAELNVVKAGVVIENHFAD